MKPTLTSAIKLCLLLMLTCFGCSKPPLSPVELAQQIATADRVVLTNFPSSSCEFSGAEARKLIRAVSESKGARLARLAKKEAPSGPGGFYLQFYRGTNLLAQVEGYGNLFYIHHVCYVDRSRVLQAAWETVYEEDKRLPGRCGGRADAGQFALAALSGGAPLSSDVSAL